MKKITLIVLNNFKNDSRVLKEALSLQSAGYDVVVVALHDEGLKEIDMVETIKVERIKLKSRGWSKNKLIQFIKYFEFIYKTVKKYKHSDILHCNDLNALPIGVLVKLFFNKKVQIVYDAHEYEINDKPNESQASVKIKYFFENFLIKYADKVICVSEAIANAYVALYKIKKPTLVLNTPPYIEIEKKDIFRENFKITSDQTIFLYQGGLSFGRGIEILLETFYSLADQENVIVFMGYGPLDNLVQKYANESENIYYQEAVSPTVLLNFTSSADYGILFYENNCLNHDYCSPNKMFEYLMTEIPVIVSNLTEMKRLVTMNEIGVVAPSNDVDGLKFAIKSAKLLNVKKMVANIKKIKYIYNWEEQEKSLVKLYRELD